jgi:uncharacterized protein YjiS (DUF1127 family)
MISYIDAYTRAVVPSTIVGGPREIGRYDLALSVATYKLVDGIGRLLSSVASRYQLWRERQRTVRILSELDDRTLADIGIERHLIGEQVDSLIVSHRRDGGCGDRHRSDRHGADPDAALVA